MFVRCKKRFKDGKEHRYWSVVENVRVSGGRVVQRQVLYLGEINDSQRAASPKWWRGRHGEAGRGCFPRTGRRQLECAGAARAADLARPRQWGACWLALTLWERLELDRFSCRRAAKGPDGWIFSGSTRAATGVFIGSGTNTVHCAICWDVTGRTARRCIGADKLTASRSSSRSCARVGRRCSTRASTSCSSDLPAPILRAPPRGQAQFSRDKRRDCVQVVIALVVTPDGFPLAMAGNIGQHHAGGLSHKD